MEITGGGYPFSIEFKSGGAKVWRGDGGVWPVRCSVFKSNLTSKTIARFGVIGCDEVLPMVLTGLASLIFGNILLRVMLELTMSLIVVWENTSDIRLLLVRRDELLKGEDDKLPEIKEHIDEKQPEVEELAIETSVEVERPNFSQQPEAMQSELHQQQIPETPEAPNTPQSQAE